MDSSARERRSSERIPLTVVGISLDGRWCARGRIEDISLGGVRIEGSGTPLALGTRVQVGFVLSGAGSAGQLDRFELPVSVVRHTESGGFAVAFEQTDPRLAEVLEGFLRHARLLREKQLKAGCALAALLP